MTAIRLSVSVQGADFGEQARQVPFALAKAINDSLLDGQKAQRTHMAEAFTIRRKPFVERSVKVTQFANKNTVTGELAIEPPGGEARADLFTKFETGGKKTPREGGSIAIPITGTPIKRTARSVIPQAKRPRQILAQPESGEARYVLIRRDDGSGLIVQRRGRGKREQLVPVYLLSKEAPIDNRLRFVPTVTKAVQAGIQGHFVKRFAEAVATSRTRT